MSLFCFVFNDTATTEIYTLSLHDALPIYLGHAPAERVVNLLLASGVGEVIVAANDVCDAHIAVVYHDGQHVGRRAVRAQQQDRKSTRLNSSHANISYAVFCLKKKNIKTLS